MASSQDTSVVERYVRSFSFGIKLGVLITGLAVPAALWVLTVFVFVPAMKEWPTFATDPILLLGLFSSEDAAKDARDEPSLPRRPGQRVVYDVEIEDKPTFYALTNNETSSDQLTLTLRLLSLLYPDVLRSPPGLLEGRVPESARTVAGRKVRPLGRLAQATVVVGTSLLCFAVYFPLGGAIIRLLKKGRARRSITT